MRSARRPTLVLLAALAPAAAGAQAAGAQAAAPLPPIELGVDGSFGAAFSDDATVVGLGVPNTRVRAGFFLGDRVALEPSVGLQAARSRSEFEVPASGFGAPGGVATSTVTARQTTIALDADLGLLVHLGGEPRRPGAIERRPYVRPFVGFQTVRFSGSFDDPSGLLDGAQSTSETETLGRFGLGVGVRRRVADRLALRVEALAARTTGDRDSFSFSGPTGGPATTSVGIAFGLSYFGR